MKCTMNVLDRVPEQRMEALANRIEQIFQVSQETPDIAIVHNSVSFEGTLEFLEEVIGRLDHYLIRNNLFVEIILTDGDNTFEKLST